jgi:hypothetical protein
VPQRGLGGRRVRQRIHERATLLHGTAQDGVDKPGAARRLGLGQLDRLADGRVGGDPVEEDELEGPEPQRGQQRGLQALDRPRGQRRDHVVERRDALDGAVGQLRGQRAVAGVQAGAGQLAVERPVGPGALLEDPSHDRVGDCTRGAHHGVPTGFASAVHWATFVPVGRSRAGFPGGPVSGVLRRFGRSEIQACRIFVQTLTISLKGLIIFDESAESSGGRGH